MALQEILLTLSLLTGTPEIQNNNLPTIPYSKPTRQEAKHKIPEAILSENKYDIVIYQDKFYKP